MRPVLRRLAQASLPVALLLAVTPAAGAATAPSSCVPVPAGSSPSGPTTAADFNAFFAGLGGEGWTGGDATWSVRLDAQRVAWFFGDTFLGGVTGTTRGAGSKMVSNTMVVQTGWCGTTHFGGTAAAQAALVRPAQTSQWNWPAQPVLENGLLRVLYGRIARTGSGAWDFAGVGTDLATFDPATLQLRSVEALPTGSAVLYGAGAIVRGGHTYVYGVEDLGAEKYLHVARAPVGRLNKAWQFHTASGWSRSPAGSLRLLANVANQVTVLPDPATDGVVAISQLTPFSSDVMAFRAPTPEGRFGAGRLMTTLPSATGTWTYNALAHPAFRPPSQPQLVSYNRNGDAAMTDATIYRPRFVDAPVP
jgi:hypothetical protein